MSLSDLDPVLLAPKRLAILALVCSVSSVDFGFLRDHFGLTDSDLSKQMSALLDAGYITVSKTRPGRGGTTTYRSTGAGSRAFAAHRSALAALINPTAIPAPSPAGTTNDEPSVR